MNAREAGLHVSPRRVSCFPFLCILVGPKSPLYASVRGAPHALEVVELIVNPPGDLTCRTPALGRVIGLNQLWPLGLEPR